MKEMAKISGLQRKGLTYFVRVRVPKDLKPHFEKGEIVRTLDTRDYSVAIKRIHAERATIEAEFEKKRQQVKAQAGGYRYVVRLYSRRSTRSSCSPRTMW